MCSRGESRDFSWINLYGKGDLNIKVVNEFSQVEALCPKWWGRERARLIWIAAIAQCQGMEERRPLVAGIINREINFWSPLERLQPARCGEISYLVTPASHKSQQGQNMCKNYLFSSFQKRCWKKKKRHWKDCTYTWYLTKTPNVWAADCNLSNFEVLRGLPPTLILCLWLPTVKVFCSCPIITVLQQLVCNLSNSKTIPQKEVIKLKCKAIVLNYYVRDRKLRHRERLVCLTKDDFLDTPQYTRQVTDTKGPKGYPHIS